MFKKTESLNINIGKQLLGKMILSDKNICLFEYNPEFINNGFSISPFYLPLKLGVFTSRPEPFGGLFGVFNDSLPDGWGRLLIDRYLHSKGIQINSLSVLDRLAIVGSKGVGALSYMPDKHIEAQSENNNLDFVANEVRKIISDEENITSIEQLAAQGGSSGGARPKVFIKRNNESWIVKFPSSIDPKNIGEIEYKYSIVARKCGIEMTDTELLEEKYFATKRFDREGQNRIHMHSAAGLLYADFRYPSLDYTELIKATLALTKSLEEAYKLFRLMVFNVLTGNMDDHAKNFSYLFENGEWKLSPAYDLVPSQGINGNHTTTINGKGQPILDDIFSVAINTGLNIKTAKKIFDEVYSNCGEIRKFRLE